jgi:hypothetical protein
LRSSSTGPLSDRVMRSERADRERPWSRDGA